MRLEVFISVEPEISGIEEQEVEHLISSEEERRREEQRRKKYLNEVKRTRKERKSLEKETERLLRARENRDAVRRTAEERDLEFPVTGGSRSSRVRVCDVMDEKGNRKGDVVIEQPSSLRAERSAVETQDDIDSEIQFNVKARKGPTKVAVDPIQDVTNRGARSKRRSTTTTSLDGKSEVAVGEQIPKATEGNVTGSSPRVDHLEMIEDCTSMVTHTPTKSNRPRREMMMSEDVINAKKEVDEKIARLEKQLSKMTSGRAATCVGGRRNRFRLAYDESDSDEWIMEEFGETPRGKLSSSRSLPEFDGNNLPLSIFLSRFSNCARYFKWDRPSRLYYLVSVLTGVPGDIVARNPDWTERDIIRELKMRYGNANRALAFQKQLEAVRQTPGQKIQDIHEEVSRLLALAFPGDKGRAVDVMGCNAFYRALSNQEFSRALQTQYPIDLADALVAALSA